MESGAPIFIVVGALAVLVGLVPVFGVLDGFTQTGFQEHSDEAEVERLGSLIEDQCDNLEEYDTALSQQIEVNIYNHEIAWGNREFEPDEGDWSVSVDCSYINTIQLYIEGNQANSFGEGSWDAHVSGSDDTIEVDLS